MECDIIKDFKGSPDGHTVIQYEKGQVNVELAESLAEVAIAEKWAKPSKSSKKDADAKAKAEAEAKRAEAIAAIEQEIAALEQQLAAAADAGLDCKEIEAQIEAKQAEHAAL